MLEENHFFTERLKETLSSLGVDLDVVGWSVYAAIFSFDTKACEYELISLGSGTRCLPDGIITDEFEDCLVHDMHAEVVCRRSFVSFILQKLIEIMNNNQSNRYLLFDDKHDKYFWNPELELIFYTSQSPCKISK